MDIQIIKSLLNSVLKVHNGKNVVQKLQENFIRFSLNITWLLVCCNKRALYSARVQGFRS